MKKKYNSNTINRLTRKAVKETFPLFISGESGVGKRHLAENIHTRIHPHQPFVTLNCSAVGDPFFIPVDDLRGRIASAKKGTLFLENFDKLSPAFHRYFQDLPCRVITASEKKDFELPREHILNFKFEKSSQIIVPPLWAREDEIRYFFNYFLEYYCNEFDKPLPTYDPDFYTTLMAYEWPLNVSELKMSVRAMVLMADSAGFDICILPADYNSPYQQIWARYKDKTMKEALDDVMRHIYSHHLTLCAGSQTKTGIELGISEACVRYHMRRLGLDRKQF